MHLKALTYRAARAIAVALALAAVALLAAGCASGPSETRDDTLTVSGTPNIIVKSVNGFIHQNGGGEPGKVRVEADLRDTPRIEYSVRQDGDTITVEAKIKRGWVLFRTSPRVDITVTAPASADTDLNTSNGAVEVTGIGGTGKARTSNGSIMLRNAGGSFDSRTSNGTLLVETFEGTIYLISSNGNAVVSGLKGEMEIHTSNGNIAASAELSPRGHSRLVSSNGSVDVTLLGTPSAYVDARTSNGRVRSDIPIETTSFETKEVRGKIGTGAAELTIRTSNGNVTIR
jgi:DUF4097 and DUF4098 domain-containing protein YvlB